MSAIEKFFINLETFVITKIEQKVIDPYKSGNPTKHLVVTVKAKSDKKEFELTDNLVKKNGKEKKNFTYPMSLKNDGLIKASLLFDLSQAIKKYDEADYKKRKETFGGIGTAGFFEKAVFKAKRIKNDQYDFVVLPLADLYKRWQYKIESGEYAEFKDIPEVQEYLDKKNDGSDNSDNSDNTEAVESTLEDSDGLPF